MNGGIRCRVFLVGCPRSGTTLLQGMLASHPEIESFPETHFFEKGFSGKNSSRKKRMLTLVLRGLYLRTILSLWIQELDRLGYEVPDSVKLGRGWSRSKVVDNFVRILDSLTLNNDKSVWVEKTPGHVLHISTISRYVGKSKFVHIVRDGRPVVASLYEVSRQFPDGWGGQWTIEKCISMWNACLASTSERLGEAEHFAVSYERLLEDPEKHLRRLCSFLGVRYEATMLSGYAAAMEKIVTGGEGWKDKNLRPLKDSGLTKYLETFDETERRRIEEQLDWPEFYRVKEFSEQAQGHEKQDPRS